MSPSLLLPLLFATAAHAQTPSRGPYFVEASSTAVRVCWRIGEQRRGDACRRLDGLEPGESFTYSLDGSTRTWTATALPADDAGLRFAAFGDIGTGDENQYRVAAVLEQWDPALVIIAGDIVYPTGKDEDYDANYFRPYANLLTRAPFFPALGNHDYGNTDSRKKGKRRFRKHYVPIHQRPRYYSFDAGGAHFVSLDDNLEGAGVKAAASIAPGSEQLRWLEKDLKGSTARWKIVFLHVPLYTCRKHGNHEKVRKSLEPLLERHGVDVVFAGHNHHYERSRPVKGVTYVTVGMGGARLYKKTRENKWSEKFLEEFGFVGVALTPDELTLEMIDAHGRIRDRHVIKK